MPKHLLIMADAVGRATHAIVDDPYAALAQRVVDGHMSAKQAAVSPDHVIELLDKKRLSGADLERLREELTRRDIDGDANFETPWPWATKDR